MKKTNKSAVLLLVLLVLVAISAMYVASTYAKYTADVTGNGTATVAAWKFSEDNETVTITANITPTADPTTLVEGKIAPGTSGTFDIQLSNANSDVGVDYTVTIGTVSYPQNLVLNGGTNTITGQIERGDSVTVSVPWTWAYSTDAAGDAKDTTDGTASSLAVTVPLTITGVQTVPSETAISTH